MIKMLRETHVVISDHGYMMIVNFYREASNTVSMSNKHLIFPHRLPVNLHEIAVFSLAHDF